MLIFSEVWASWYSLWTINNVSVIISSYIKDIHGKNIPSYKTEALAKSMNMCIWAIGIIDQLQKMK